MKINLPLASDTWDQKELNAATEILKSKQLTMGLYVKLFEKKINKLIKSKHCVMCNSGSSANLLIANVLKFHSKYKLKLGDEIIVPAVSWSTSYAPFYQAGCKLKFVDIDLQTLNYNLNSLEKAINKKTKVILVVNLLGNPNNFNKIFKLIKNTNIILIEDNCESLGSKYNNKFCGTIGLMGSFSTFYSHHISTMEGGFVCTNNDECYHILLSLRAHGWTRNLPKKNKIYKFPKKTENESWNFILPGYNLRPGEIHASIGIQQIKKLNLFIKYRKINAKHFINLFSNSPFYIQKEIGESSWFGFSLILKENNIKNIKELKKLLVKLKVDFRPIVTGNFTNKLAVQYMDYTIFDNLKNADYAEKFGIMIGNHHYDIRKKLTLLKKEISKIF